MYDTIIIGAGPAGLTAAIYLKRANKSVLLIEKEGIGGQIASSPLVENYPGFKAISGAELANNLYEQVDNLGCEIAIEEVLEITKDKKVITDSGEYQAKVIIIATGCEYRKLNLEGEEDFIGSGIHFCVSCDGAFYKGEEVALIGDGNTALQYSILLSNYCKKVYVCTLFDKFFGDMALVETLKKKDNVEIIPNISLISFKASEKLEGLVFKYTNNPLETIELKVPACFIAIGQVPDNKIFEGLVELDKDGYIVADEYLKTSTKGLFVAGDCRVKRIRQLTTAVSDGATAAINATSYIDKYF